jgi:uncharacterized membrane protein (UPF0127 family)
VKKFIKTVSVLFIGILMAEMTLAAPKFKKSQIKIKNKTLQIELAETQEQHSYGLMNREKLPENTGMLFVFDAEEQRFFWMKNTFINLSIAYFDKNKKIIDIQDMKAATSSLDEILPSNPSKGKAKYALEVNQGWFEKNNIKVGDSFLEIKKGK